MLFAAACACTPACGRIGFAPQLEAAPDASPCALPDLDLGPPPATPFSAPTLIAELESAAFDDDPTLPADELEIIFESARSGTSRLWRATRTSSTSPWSAPTPISELDGMSANTPELSRDGLRLRFSVSGDLHLTTRADRASAWDTPIQVSELNTLDSETSAVEFLGGAGIVFGSNRPGGNTSGDLWEALRDPADCARSSLRVLPGLDGSVKANPWMREDGLVVVYPGTGATGASDLLTARRESLDAPFGATVELTTLDSTSVDDDPWLNDAMTSIYFMSARTGDAALYHASR